MIPVSTKQTIFLHGINIDKPVLEFSDLLADPAQSVNAGQPVRVDPTSGLVVPVTTNVKLAGLSKSNKNQYVDETFGSFGAYGSGKLAFAVKGICTVRHNYFINSLGAIVTVKTFDDTQTYHPMDLLYCDANGLITNVNTFANTELGYVLVAPTPSNVALQFVLDL